MISSLLLSAILLYLSANFSSGKEIFLRIEYGNDNKFLLYYNLTTNSSYYLTFRLFEHEQIKFGVFPATIRTNTLRISNEYNTPKTLVYLFIICFHFLRRSNDIDVQCKDIRALKSDLHLSHLPTYKPLFVPMMYALSVLMLLPVIIQHRRRKQAQLAARRKQLRRLSISIAKDNPSLLSDILPNMNSKDISTEIGMVSLPSTRTFLEEMDDDDDPMRFTIQKPRIIIDTYEDEEEVGVTADECVAHLLDHTPWHSTRQDRLNRFEERIPMISKSNENESEDQESNLKSRTHGAVNSYRSNPAFTESDV